MIVSNPSSAYGASFFKILYHDIRDRLRGKKARANARWGLVRAPEGRGKLIWVRAGGSRESVHLAAEVLAAIREKRKDVRLVMTFEEDYADVYAPVFHGLRKVAVGFGSCDRPAAVKRMLERLNPLGVICVGEAPGKNFLSTLSQAEKIHSIAFQLQQPVDTGQFEACYPLAESQGVNCAYSAQPSQVETIFVPSQVEPNFGALLRGASESHLWWLHGAGEGDVQQWLSEWQAHALAQQSILICSEDNQQAESTLLKSLNNLDITPVRLSQWQRQALPAGSVVLVDESKWLPAVAASVDATHLFLSSARIYWQALAGGKPVSVSQVQHLETDVVLAADNPATVFESWQSLLTSSFSARQRGDQCRQLFWQKRREASEVVDEFLQRVYDW